MDLFWALVTLAIVHMLAVISPGQQFIAISRIAASEGRMAGLAATFGTVVGVWIWALAALAGLAIILANAAWVYTALRVAGGCYLLYVAYMVWVHARSPLPEIDVAAHKAKGVLGYSGALRDGFLTAIANPKVIMFFSSIFVTVLPPTSDLWLKGIILGIVTFNEAAWYILVTLVFSSAGPRSVYARLKVWIDRIMAIALGAIGVRLVADAAR
jgi:threonine/homoserine/homoserine lactone efflux protein